MTCLPWILQHGLLRIRAFYVITAPLSPRRSLTLMQYHHLDLICSQVCVVVLKCPFWLFFTFYGSHVAFCNHFSLVCHDIDIFGEFYRTSHILSFLIVSSWLGLAYFDKNVLYMRCKLPTVSHQKAYNGSLSHFSGIKLMPVRFFHFKGGISLF